MAIPILTLGGGVAPGALPLHKIVDRFLKHMLKVTHTHRLHPFVIVKLRTKGYLYTITYLIYVCNTNSTTNIPTPSVSLAINHPIQIIVQTGSLREVFHSCVFKLSAELNTKHIFCPLYYFKIYVWNTYLTVLCILNSDGADGGPAHVSANT